MKLTDMTQADVDELIKRSDIAKDMCEKMDGIFLEHSGLITDDEPVSGSDLVADLTNISPRLLSLIKDEYSSRKKLPCHSHEKKIAAWKKSMVKKGIRGLNSIIIEGIVAVNGEPDMYCITTDGVKELVFRLHVYGKSVDGTNDVFCISAISHDKKIYDEWNTRLTQDTAFINASRKRGYFNIRVVGAIMFDPVSESIILDVQHIENSPLNKEPIKETIEDREVQEGELVLVRMLGEPLWDLDIFRCMTLDPSPRFQCVKKDWELCIPFTGNEDLYEKEADTPAKRDIFIGEKSL